MVVEQLSPTNLPYPHTMNITIQCLLRNRLTFIYINIVSLGRKIFIVIINRKSISFQIKNKHNKKQMEILNSDGVLLLVKPLNLRPQSAVLAAEDMPDPIKRC